MEIVNNSNNSADLFYKNQNNKKYYLKKTFEPLSSYIFLLSSVMHLDITENGYDDLKKNFVKKIPFYCIVGISSTLVELNEKERIIKDKEDRTIEEQIKTHLILSQVVLSILSGIGITRGIKQTKKDHKGGIIAACLSGIALVGATISNIATWKNYKKENPNKDS